MSATPLTDIQEVRDFTGADEATVSDSLITKFIEDAEDLIEEKTGKRFEVTVVTDEIHDGNGENWMHFNHWPVISLTKVVIDDVEQDLSDFHLYKDTGLIRFKTGIQLDSDVFSVVFPKDYRNVEISYTHGQIGYKIADEIAFNMAVMRTLIVMGIKESEGAISERLGSDYNLRYPSDGPYAGQINMLKDQIKDGLDSLGYKLEYGIT